MCNKVGAIIHNELNQCLRGLNHIWHNIDTGLNGTIETMMTFQINTMSIAVNYINQTIFWNAKQRDVTDMAKTITGYSCRPAG